MSEVPRAMIISVENYLVYIKASSESLNNILLSFLCVNFAEVHEK